MFLSVIIPCKNVESTIGICLASLYSALEQVVFDYEVIVVLDDCHDNTEKIAGKYPTTLVHANGTGRSQARNTGVGVSSGRYLLFLDADCLVNKFFFKHFQDSIEHDPADWIQASIYHKAENEIEDFECHLLAEDYVRSTLGTHNVLEIAHCFQHLPKGDTAGCIVRSSAVKKVNGFDETLKRFEDRKLANMIFLNAGHLRALPELKVIKINRPITFANFLWQVVQEFSSYDKSGCRRIDQSIFRRKPRKAFNFKQIFLEFKKIKLQRRNDLKYMCYLLFIKLLYFYYGIMNIHLVLKKTPADAYDFGTVDNSRGRWTIRNNIWQNL